MILKNYPQQIKYIVGNEAAERYSFYGMKSILIVFMTKHLLINESLAVSRYHMFTAACYLLPLLGGFLSDRYLGKYRTIIYLSLVYCLGHLILAVNETETALYWGLGFIALGSGGIKPCVSAHVGDQFKPHESHLLQNVFNIFYWMINFGSFFATLITPWTYVKFGPQIAFGIPGILMFIATFIFWLGRKYYVHIPPTGPNPDSFSKILVSSLTGKLNRHPAKAIEGFKAVLKIFLIYGWITVFWALFDQHGSTWVLQAQKMDLNFAGIQWHESQIQALNPILVLILIPLFSNFIYPWFEKKGFNVGPLQRMSVGLFIAASSFCIASLIQVAIEAGHQPSVAWQFWSYFTLTTAEVMVSITGLEFAYTQAPRAMKSTIMSFWLLTVFFGNMLTSQLAKLEFFPVASTGYFSYYAVLMLVIAVVFVFFAKNYKLQNYMES